MFLSHVTAMWRLCMHVILPEFRHENYRNIFLSPTGTHQTNFDPHREGGSNSFGPTHVIVIPTHSLRTLIYNNIIYFIGYTYYVLHLIFHVKTNIRLLLNFYG